VGLQPAADGANGLANTGMGGNGYGPVAVAPVAAGGSGGSGVVIVSWWEAV
jgi:hypothetical protein